MYNPSPAMQLLEETLDCLVASVNITPFGVALGFIKPQGGSICIQFTAKDGVVSVSEINNGQS